MGILPMCITGVPPVCITGILPVSSLLLLPLLLSLLPFLHRRNRRNKRPRARCPCYTWARCPCHITKQAAGCFDAAGRNSGVRPYKGRAIDQKDQGRGFFLSIESIGRA